MKGFTGQVMESISLKTPKGLFTEFLFNVAENLVADDKRKFQFMFEGKIPANILEKDDPLQWFKSLRRQERISLDELGELEDFFKQAKLTHFFKDVKNYMVKQKIIKYLVEEIKVQSRGRFGKWTLLRDHKVNL